MIATGVIFAQSPHQTALQSLSTTSDRTGGRLVVAQKAEPRTLNPVTAIDAASREILGLLHADLIHINRKSGNPEPSIAASWTVSTDGRRYKMRLRPGLRFSDGRPLDADDVVFTFHVHLDERVNSTQRSTLLFNGRPISVRKIDQSSVEFTLSQPSASAERVFDNLAILPKHLLEPIYARGEIGKAWPLTVSPAEMAGLGPFRLKDHLPGQRLTLERNPYYWKKDEGATKLPYLDSIVFEVLASDESQRVHFANGQSQLLPAVSALNFAALGSSAAQRGYRLLNHGPGLEYTFLVLNQNDLKTGQDTNVAWKRAWFRETPFRQAISAAIDRESVARIAYGGLASPTWTHVSAGNRTWINSEIPRPARSMDRARQILREAKFTWNNAGRLLDPQGREVVFSLLTSAGNAQRSQTATIVQDDLRQLGMKVNIVELEFRSMLTRVFETHDYEAAIMTLASGDTDPNADMNVLTLRGNTRIWKLQSSTERPWELELDQLMRAQATSLNPAARKRWYDRVQQIVAEQLPFICIVNPHVLVAAFAGLENLRPSILRPYALGSAEELYFRREQARR